MKDQLIENYINCNISQKEIGQYDCNIKITFLDGVKVEVFGNKEEEYTVKFIDLNKGNIVYSSTIKQNMWTAPSIKYYVKWKVQVYKKDKLIREEILNLKEKRVKVIFDTNSLGDIIAYIGAVEEFRKIHECKIDCVVFNPHIREILIPSYPNIKFLSLDERNLNYYACYKIGWFKDWEGRAPQSPQRMCLANIAGDILQVGDFEFKPNLVFDKNKKWSNKKYVCIAIQSTAQFKYWNNPNGWREVVNYLKSIGYEVWCIDKHQCFGIEGKMNCMPDGVIDMTGEYTLSQRMEQLNGADFFIGISSGLSWLAWAVNIPVILISGIGEKWTEFFTPHRIINKKVCNSCTNDTSFLFDKGDWGYCPRNKNFECTVEISSKQVIDEIDKLTTDLYKNTIHNFDWGEKVRTSSTILHYEEIFVDKIYDKILKIEDGDTVMDIGAHVGTFSLYAFTKNIKKLIVVEPSALRIKNLKNNFSKYENVTYIKKGVSDKKEIIKNGLIFDHIVEDFPADTFEGIIEQSNTSHIDFMKIDCEGGEYFIFEEQNIDWIKNNVKKISSEWHLRSPDNKSKFKKFRDNVLTKFDNYHIYSIDGVDIKHSLFSENFIDFYKEIMIYIDNKNTFKMNNRAIETVEDKQSSPLITDPLFYKNLFQLKDRIAIITGAGGHLGAAMAMGLVSNQATVIALGRDVEKIRKKLYTSQNTLSNYIIPIECDVTNELKFKEIVEWVIEKYKKVDILINNAFSEKRKPIENIEKTDWNKGMDDILTQQFMCCKSILPYMVNRNFGSIINIASIYGSIGIDQRAYQEVPSSTIFYCAAKAGSIQMTKELAIRYADKGIRINSISPGHFPKPPTDPSKANPRYVSGLADMVPMKRVGSADELAGAAVFLASDASSYVTGQNLIVDGGRTIW